MAGLADIVDFVRSKFTPQETETEVVQEEVDLTAPEFTRTMLIEDHPTDYIEGAQDRVHEKIKKYNANPNAVVGIMANLKGENSAFDYKKKQDLNKIGDGLGPGRGLFQFDYMKKHYNEYLDSNQIPDSESAQIHWAMEQIYTDNPNDSILGGPQAKKLRRALENASTPEQATTAFFEIFENPSPNDPKRRQEKLKKRLEYIKEFETKATGGMVMRNPYNNYNKQRII